MANNKEIIITGQHMDLTEALKQTVHDKADRLFRHDDHIIRLRVELGPTVKKHAKEEFTAKGHVEVRGSDIHASETSEDLYKSIDKMVDKLDRSIRQRAEQEQTKRRKRHEIDIPADIPKTNNNGL